MQIIKCELCGSTSFKKEDSDFVCQQCGTRFSLEETKKMMVDGTVEIQGTVKNETNDSVRTYIELSESAYNSGNGESAFEYANKALELSPQSPEAWLAKMRSIEYLGTMGNLRLREVVEAGKNAITFADGSQKEEVENTVYVYYLSRALELLNLATSKLLEVDEVKRTYRTFNVISVFTANQNCHNADSGFVKIYENIASEAMSLLIFVPNEQIEKSSEMAKLLLSCAQAYKNETDAVTARYKIYGTSLTSEAIASRNSTIKAYCDTAINALKNSDPSYVDNNNITPIEPVDSSGGCYVATAVYGSYDCPEVWTLRRYRDYTLAKTWYGRAFIKTYYAISPTLVKWFGHTDWFKKMWKGKLDQMVANLRADGFEDTPYEDKNW